MIKIIIIAALIKLLIVTDKPLLCAALYTSVVFALNTVSVMGGRCSLFALLVATVISFVLSTLYFFLLSRFSEGILFWVIAIVGIFIGLI
jgi:hypothetical protein